MQEVIPITTQYDADKCRQWIQDNVDIDFFHAVSDPARSQLLVLLASTGEQTIGEIAAAFPQNRSVISRHLDYLNRFGAVSRRKVGREVLYKANTEAIVAKFEQTTDHMKAVIHKLWLPFHWFYMCMCVYAYLNKKASRHYEFI